jgi:hypothetical protein
MEALVHRIRRSQDPGMRARAAAAIANICSGDSADIKQRAAGAGALEALVQLLIISSHADALLAATLALAFVCSGTAQTPSSGLQLQGLLRRWCSSSAAARTQ